MDVRPKEKRPSGGGDMTECTSESTRCADGMWDGERSQLTLELGLGGDSEFTTRSRGKNAAQEGTSVSKGLELRDDGTDRETTAIKHSEGRKGGRVLWEQVKEEGGQRERWKETRSKVGVTAPGKAQSVRGVGGPMVWWDLGGLPGGGDI